jgi:hypothetical protein
MFLLEQTQQQTPNIGKGLQPLGPQALLEL